MISEEFLKKLAADAGHAINANNGKCALIEDVLCRVTTLCVQVSQLCDDRRELITRLMQIEYAVRIAADMYKAESLVMCAGVIRDCLDRMKTEGK